MSVFVEEMELIEQVQSRAVIGTVSAVRGMTIFANDLRLPVGTIVRIENGGSDATIARGEVIGFDGARTVVMMLHACTGIKSGASVVSENAGRHIRAGESLLGRVINGLGEPIDSLGRLRNTKMWPLQSSPTVALSRRRIHDPLPTGVRAIDSMLTLGKGQRVGIFSGAGVGKSTLLGSIARNTSAQVNVIGLIGERGREVRDFLADALGESGLRRSVVIVATGDESPALRVRAALVSCAIAEYFRENGADVMLMIDSITRFAQAQRQIGLSMG
jgi:flagellum-specific ATP synthase